MMKKCKIIFTHARLWQGKQHETSVFPNYTYYESFILISSAREGFKEFGDREIEEITEFKWLNDILAFLEDLLLSQ